MFVLLLGNPADGFSFIGPFKDDEDAQAFTDALGGEDWWLCKLEPPEGEEEDCEFAQIDDHEWRCTTHAVTMIGPEPVTCTVLRRERR